MSHNSVKCFAIYSALPRDLAETIENGILNISAQAASYLEVSSWKQPNSVGKPVLKEVCRSIDSSAVVLCDLSRLSWNVLFELGYAIAHNKRVWISIRNSDAQAKQRLKRASLISGLAYETYENSTEFANRFVASQPYADIENTIFRDTIAWDPTGSSDEGKLFYLKSAINTEASLSLTRLLDKSGLPLLTDDTDEVRSNSLEWYLQNVYSALAVLCHFAPTESENEIASLQNDKYALMSGMAHGFDKRILALAHAPFPSPVDFRDILHVHETANECTALSEQWLAGVVEVHKARQVQMQRVRATLEREVGLRRIDLGQYVAENEAEELSEYFVATAPFTEALNPSQYMIYVGRKGSGKSAILYQLALNLRANRRNFVCVIRPVDYEFEGLIYLLGPYAR